MGLISRVSSRTYRYTLIYSVLSLFIMSRVTKTLEASMKDRIDSYDDQELRSECINSGLKPGPVNNQTRSGWAKRLLSKRMKEAKPAKQETPKEVDAEFSADEDAINVEIIDVEGEGEAVVPDQKNNVLTEVSNVAITGDAEFSGDDEPVEEDDKAEEEEDTNVEEEASDIESGVESEEEKSEEKSEENNDNKPNESMMVNMSKPDIGVNLLWKTADTSSMEVEATISGENTEVEEKMSEKSEEKTGPEVVDSESAKNPESSDCKMMSCLKTHYESSCTYLQENKNEITELVVVLLIAYLLFMFKDNINETFERLNATAEQVFKPVKEQVVAVFNDLKAKMPAAFPETSAAADAVAEPVAAAESSE